MNYTLNTDQDVQNTSSFKNLLGLISLTSPYAKRTAASLFFGLLHSIATLIAPYLIGYTIDHFIITKQFDGVIRYGLIILVIYLAGFITQYLQIRLMGMVGQNILYTMRQRIFTTLQALPVAFFNQNKAGDVISRINNDTDKLNEFYSQGLIQLAGSVLSIIGAIAFMIYVNPTLALVTTAPAAILLAVTLSISGWVRRQNARTLKTTGNLSGNIQENLDNMKVLIAFNRTEYFTQSFLGSNKSNYQASVRSSLANGLFQPLYTAVSSAGQLIVLAFGIWLISQGQLTLGGLVSFISYVRYLYDPLNEIAQNWSIIQLALAAWERIGHIIGLKSDMEIMPADNTTVKTDAPVITFDNVSFSYPNGQPVLNDINLSMEHGKTYALVGPTGGGKTTTASLMARLYDPTQGHIRLNGQDIRTFTPEQRAEQIGFILQEPFLFNGTIKDNLAYGNPKLASLSDKKLLDLLKQQGLADLLKHFDKGLQTEVVDGGNSISLGQKQLIAFIRAAIRQPSLLILDEATANVDTVTEQLLQSILDALPETTTKVIIAHRLNTIEKADQIFFVNSGTITNAGSLQHAMDLLMHGQKPS